MNTNEYAWVHDGMFGCWIRLPASFYAMYDSAAISIHMSPNTTTEEKRALLFRTIRNLGGVFVPDEFAPYSLPQRVSL